MRRIIIPLIVLLVVAGAAGGGGYLFYMTFRLSDAVFPLHGLDVSHHQGEIDWNAVATDPPAFVFMKATEGGDFRDTRFQENWQEAARVGIPRGAYHFFTLCRPGADQARNFIDAVPRDPAALPPVVDLEFGGNCADRPDQAAFVAELQAFLDPVERHYGRSAMIYTTADFYRRYLEGQIEDRPYWAMGLVLQPRFRDAGWTVWQYHHHGTWPGIDGPVDLNVFAGGVEAFAEFAGN